MTAEPIEADETEPPPLNARAAGWLFMTGSGLGFALLLLTGAGHGDALGMAIVLGTAGLVGAAVYVNARRLPAWFFPPLAIVASLTVTSLIYFTHDGGSPFAFFYVWVAVWVFH